MQTQGTERTNSTEIGSCPQLHIEHRHVDIHQSIDGVVTKQHTSHLVANGIRRCVVCIRETNAHRSFEIDLQPTIQLAS
jgi:hypothetical protein